MKKTLKGAVVAVLMLALATGLGLSFIHISDIPYKADIQYLNIEASSGLPRQEILQNYNAAMDFLSPFSNEKFDLPTLKYSETGEKHFEDCKPIFNGVYLVAILALVIIVLMLWKGRFSGLVLRISGWLTLLIPCLLGLFVWLDFNRMFVLFHKVFFSDDTWIFDPRTDEIINILPAEFFMHCALLIAVFWVLIALIQLIAGYQKKANTNY